MEENKGEEFKHEEPGREEPKELEVPRMHPIENHEIPKSVIEEPKKVFTPEKPKRVWLEKIKVFIKECRRVLRVTKKPDKVEFKTIVKVSGLGIVIIGVIGFLIFFIKEIFFK